VVQLSIRVKQQLNIKLTSRQYPKNYYCRKDSKKEGDRSKFTYEKQWDKERERENKNKKDKYNYKDPSKETKKQEVFNASSVMKENTTLMCILIKKHGFKRRKHEELDNSHSSLSEEEVLEFEEEVLSSEGQLSLA